MLEFLTTRRATGRAAAALDQDIDIGQLLRERERVLTRFSDQAAPITRLLSVARAIPLGDGLRVVGELRLADLAELQAFLEVAEPNPLEGMPPAWEDPDPDGRPARLRAAWEAAAHWPPKIGTARGSRLLNTEAGRQAFLLICLRRGDPRAGLPEVLATLPRITPTQWAGLKRVAYGLTPREEIAAEVCPLADPDRPADWAAAFFALVDRGIGWSDLANLTLGQWRHLCSGGKAAEHTPEYRAMVRRYRTATK